jgi:ankyrin repeat protein
VIRLLAKAGADLNAQDRDGNTAALHLTDGLESAKTLIELGARINILNNEGDTPLINTGSGEVAKLLLQAGADPAVCNIHGLTALDFALAHNWKGKVEALQATLSRTHKNGTYRHR